MVTNATSVRGIGNRPGRPDFLSGPLFPYGKRIMSLPIWAHAAARPTARCSCRKRLFPGRTWRELPRLARVVLVARSLLLPTVEQNETQAPSDQVDAITCASSSIARRGSSIPRCRRTSRPAATSRPSIPRTKRSPTFAAINDLDAVAAATPLRLRLQRDVACPLGTAPRRLRADGRGEQGVRLQRVEHAPGFRRSATGRLRYRGQFRTALCRLSGPDSHRPDLRNDGRPVDLPDCRLRRLDRADRRHQPARRHHLDQQSGVGRGAAARDQRQQQRAQRARAGEDARAVPLRRQPLERRHGPDRAGRGAHRRFGHPAVHQGAGRRRVGPAI